MPEFDLVVIGGGTGNKTAKAAAEAGWDVALIEEGKLGGTCLNRGCNPSKMLIAAARELEGVEAARRFGIDARVESVDFTGIVDEVNETLGAIADGMGDSFREHPDLTFYNTTGRFVDERTLEVDGVDEPVVGERVVVAAGTRPLVPPIEGIEEVDYLTSAEALQLRDRPDSMVILGGGYIAAELGYFFETMGTEVTMVEMLDTLLPREDPDVAEAFTEVASRRHDVYVGHRATAVEATDDGVVVHAETEDGETVEPVGEELLVAVGRRPNTDRIDAEAGGIELDDRGFPVTDEQLRTSVDGVWAQGDIAGNHLFKHSADYETGVVVENVVHDAGRAVDYTAIGHAVFTEPQVGAVGRTETELRDAGVDYVVGRAEVPDQPMARALKLEDGFAKALVAPDGEILGAHVFGHEASMLVHEVITAMRAGGDAHDVAGAIHVHPALNRVVEAAFADALSKLD